MKVLFVCTGNTCRSPLAEALARREVAARALADIEVASAGTSAWDGGPASDGAMLVALEHQIDLTEHRSRLLTNEIVADADLILTMGPHHLERVEALGGGGKAFLLTDYGAGGAGGGEGRSISDPFGGDLEVYRATLEELEREVRRVIDRIAVERGTEGA